MDKTAADTYRQSKNQWICTRICCIEHQRSRCQSSEALSVLGVAVSPNVSHRAPASPTCAFGSHTNDISADAHGVMRSKGVSARTVTF